MRKKQNSVFDKFQKFWRTLTRGEQKALWDVMAAVRGPDNGSNAIKFLTTARIRHLLIGGSRKERQADTHWFSAYIFSSLREAKEDGVSCRITPKKAKEELYDNVHFDKHIRAALRALQLRYWTKVSSIAKSIGMDLKR